MPAMTRCQIATRATLSAFLLAGLAVGAVAAPPAVLDRVPADAHVVVAVQQVNDFLADLDQINRMLGENANPGMLFATSMVRGMPGINLDGAAAFIITMPEDPEAAEPTVVALLPVSDFAALTQGREAENGVVRLTLPDNEVYARDLGDGHAAISDNADAVRAFDAAKGRMKAHTDRVGAAGGKVVSDAEVSIIANAEALRPILNQGIVGLKQQGEMVAMMAGEQAGAGVNSAATVAEMVVRDMSASVFGLTISDAGMTYDMAMQFTEGSESAAFFAKPGSTAGLMDRLPAQRYMFAAALDTSSPTIAKLGTAFDAWLKAQPEGATPAMGQMSLADLHKLTQGVSFVMGTPPGLMGGGLFTNTTQFIKTSDPAAYQKALIEGFKAASGQENQGVKMTATITPDAVTIDGTALTAFGVNIQLDPAAAGGMMPGMDPAMVTQMIFGPTGGPTGYLASVEGGVVQTMTQGPDMTRRSLAAAKGTNTLGANERVTRVAGNLQKDRIAEIYIGIDEILNTVGPTLMMFGAIPEFQPMAAIDPVALGLATDANGFSGRIFLPSDAFQAISKMIPQNPGMGEEGAGDEGFDF